METQQNTNSSARAQALADNKAAVIDLLRRGGAASAGDACKAAHISTVSFFSVGAPELPALKAIIFAAANANDQGQFSDLLECALGVALTLRAMDLKPYSRLHWLQSLGERSLQGSIFAHPHNSAAVATLNREIAAELRGSLAPTVCEFAKSIVGHTLDSLAASGLTSQFPFPCKELRSPDTIKVLSESSKLTEKAFALFLASNTPQQFLEKLIERELNLYFWGESPSGMLRVVDSLSKSSLPAEKLWIARQLLSGETGERSLCDRLKATKGSSVVVDVDGTLRLYTVRGHIGHTDRIQRIIDLHNSGVAVSIVTGGEISPIRRSLAKFGVPDELLGITSRLALRERQFTACIDDENPAVSSNLLQFRWWIPSLGISAEQRARFPLIPEEKW